MKSELSAISDFVLSNSKALASYLRQKLIDAGAKGYVEGLGKQGIGKLEQEASGVLLDLACALLRRLQPGVEFDAEAILHQLPAHVQKTIRLPRSQAYNAVLAELEKIKKP